jgi:hypothetical protein
LEASSPVQLSFPWQDAGYPFVQRHHSESLQAGGSAGQDPQGGHAAHSETQLRDGTSGSGSRPADNRSLAGPQELYDYADLLARPSTAPGPGTQPDRLATDPAVSQVDPTGGRSGPTEPAAADTEAASGTSAERLRVIDLLREYTFGFVARHPRQAPPQVRSVLAKLSLCRTKALRGHTYECPRCDYQTQIYNSCTDRHCPLCSGARRADWLDKTSQLLLPGINYFQVVFTVPDSLHGLMLGNRRETFNVLFRSAWASLRDLLRKEQGIEPAAQMVLHTWNQELDFHLHVHALVPGGGPSEDQAHWKETRHPTQRRRKKPYLADREELSRRFREQFIIALKRLHRRGELKLGPQSVVRKYQDFERWVDSLPESWGVYIQGPPRDESDPQHVLKYLARYMTGGPISDGRLIAHEDGQVVFWARSKDKRAGNPSRPFPLSGPEFTRRWATHILPKGYTKSRRYGGYSSRLCRDYLDCCRALLGITDQASQDGASDEVLPPSSPNCP